MDELVDVRYALNLLKEKKILIARSDPKRTLILMRDGLITVKNQNLTYTINQDDFLDIYKDEQFFIYEDDGFDPKEALAKDAEYYSWRHK